MPDRTSQPVGTQVPRLVVAAVAVALAVATALVVGGVTAADAAARCGGDAPAGMVRVAIVVDYGTQPGAPTGPSVVCLVLTTGSTGGDLLRERASLLGTSKPRYAASGLLCAIDGYPPGGCGEVTGGRYLYWSSWSGQDGSWVYASGNPFTRRLHDGEIVGWSFVMGAGGPQDPPPRVAPDPAAVFPPPPSSPSPPSAGPGGGGGSGVTGEGAGASAPGADAAGARTQGARAPADDATTPDGAAAPDGAEPGAPDRSGAPSAGDADGSSGPTTGVAPEGTTDPGAEELAVQPASSKATAATATGAVPGLIVGLLVVVGLTTAAIVRSRRSADS